jgi:N-acetylglucosamine-6-phosphate deacetylase
VDFLLSDQIRAVEKLLNVCVQERCSYAVGLCGTHVDWIGARSGTWMKDKDSIATVTDCLRSVSSDGGVNIRVCFDVGSVLY